MRERCERLLTRGLEEIGAQVDRRAVGERPALLGRVGAEGGLELRRKPFREVARDMGRSVRERGGRKPFALGFGQRGWRMSFAGEQRRNRLGVEPSGLLKGADRLGARGRLAQEPGRRTLPAQRVVDERRNRGAIAGAREAMREPPVLHGVGGGTAAGFDVAQDFDGGGDTGCGGHAPSCRKSRLDAKKRYRSGPISRTACSARKTLL